MKRDLIVRASSMVLLCFLFILVLLCFVSWFVLSLFFE